MPVRRDKRRSSAWLPTLAIPAVIIVTLALGSIARLAHEHNSAGAAAPVTSNAPSATTARACPAIPAPETTRPMPSGTPLALRPTDAPRTTYEQLVKTKATLVAVLSADVVKVWLSDRNVNDQAVWNDALLIVRATARTAYPNTGASSLIGMGLRPGDVVTLTFFPSDYDAGAGAYPALVIGREAFVCQ